MKAPRFILVAVAALGLAASVSAQNLPAAAGTSETILTSATALTNVYVSSKPVPLATWNACALKVAVSTADPAATLTTRYQWSPDKTNWFTEAVMAPGTASATAQPYTPLDFNITMTATNGASFGDRVVRVMPWFRVQVKSSEAASSNRVSVVATPLNN